MLNMGILSGLRARVEKLEETNDKLSAQIDEAQKLQLDTEKKLKDVSSDNDFKRNKIAEMNYYITERQEHISNLMNENNELQRNLDASKTKNDRYADKQIIWELKYNDLKNTENILKLQRNALQEYETTQKELWDQITNIRDISTEDMQKFIDLDEVKASLSGSAFAKFYNDLTKMDVSNKANMGKLMDITVEYLRDAMPNARDDNYETKLLTDFMNVKLNDSETDVNTMLKII